MTGPDDDMLAALRASNKHARTACHAAFGATTDPSAIYSRNGELHGLASKLQQLTGHLARQAELAAAAPDNLYSTDDVAPEGHLVLAARDLRVAQARLALVTDAINDAWSHLSPVGVRS